MRLVDRQAGVGCVGHAEEGSWRKNADQRIGTPVRS
jgi:hypothetical protein